MARLLATVFLSIVLAVTASAQTLIQAAEQGDTAAIERLIASGVAIDATDAAGCEAMMALLAPRLRG